MDDGMWVVTFAMMVLAGIVGYGMGSHNAAHKTRLEMIEKYAAEEDDEVE